MNQSSFITHLVTDVGLPMVTAFTLMDTLIVLCVTIMNLEENQTTIITARPNL